MVIKVGQSTWILVPNILVFYHFFKLLVNFSIFLNFLHFGEGEGEGEDQKRLVGLRRASAAGKNFADSLSSSYMGRSRSPFASLHHLSVSLSHCLSV